MKKIEKVGFVIKPHAPDIKETLKNLLRYFEEKNISCYLENDAADILGISGGLIREEIPENVDLVVVLGGDGTLLSIAHKAAVKDVPVLGVNLGSLGFLTEVPLNEMYFALDAFLEGNQKIVSLRQMLEVTHGTQTFTCLNDVVINKGALARMIQVAIWIDGKEITALRADGLIISTPTGSTAYSLSAGGPVIHPYIPAIIIAPICPHTLSVRPMIVSADSVIKVRLLTGKERVYVTIDGQRGGLMQENEIIAVKKSSNCLNLVSSPKRNYFDLLQEKLGWG
jgi:NAD+ kinase